MPGAYRDHLMVNAIQWNQTTQEYEAHEVYRNNQLGVTVAIVSVEQSDHSWEPFSIIVSQDECINSIVSSYGKSLYGTVILTEFSSLSQPLTRAKVEKILSEFMSRNMYNP